MDRTGFPLDRPRRLARRTWALAAVACATAALAAPAQARTVRVAGVARGSSATFAVAAAPEQARRAQLARGGVRVAVPVRVLRAGLAKRTLRLPVARALRRARGRLVLTLRLAPQTSLRAGGDAGVWRVTSDSPGARFSCRVDEGAWRACGPTWSAALSAGSHVLLARARDGDGLEDATPARATATVPASGASGASPSTSPAPSPSATSPSSSAPATSPSSAPSTSSDPLAVGSAFRAFATSKSFVNARLPDNAALSRATVNGLAVNPAVAGELQQQASTYGTYLNMATYTAPLTVVPATQPLTPVRCAYGQTPCAWAMRQMMLGISPTGADLNGGLPIPDDYVPAPASDTDAEAVFYQPDYVGPSGLRGRLYEVWKLRRNSAYDPSEPVSPTNPRWTAATGGRVVGTQTSPGHYVSWTASGYQYKQPGHPDSSYQDSYWGVLASGLFIASDEVRREDCSAGRIDHAIGLLVHNAKPGHVWPAQRDDGTQASSSLLEGMRLRFPPGMAKPAFSNRLAAMLFDAAQDYGLVIDDKTNANVGVRVEPERNGRAAAECWALLDGARGYDALANFPWSKLRVVATGSDALPTPTS